LLTTSAEPDGAILSKAVKSISFRYTAPDELSSVFAQFRSMCNEAIRICLSESPRSRFDLIVLAYKRLKEYGLHTHYILAACEVAFSLYKHRNRISGPVVTRPFLKLDRESYRLNRFLLRMPTTPGRYIFLVLAGSDYHRSFIDNPELKRGSVTVNEQNVIITFSKCVRLSTPRGHMGVDVNEQNVTISSSDGYERKFTELGEIVEIKERYREIRAKVGGVASLDRRIGTRILMKYGQRERDRTRQRIHRLTKEVVLYSKDKELGIKMERLTHIQKMYRRGNRQSASYRGRMNTWVFGETQRQVDYKGRWEGVPIWFVNPRGTSRNCPSCGSRVVPLPERRLYCAKCERTWDRDILASKNIMACVVPQARPSRRSVEGERGDDGSNPPSRWREVGADDAFELVT